MGFISLKRGWRPVFSEPDYDEAVLGVSYDGKHIIYDYERMIECLIDKEGMTYEQAVEFVDYNSSFKLGNEYNEPIVLQRLDTINLVGEVK